MSVLLSPQFTVHKIMSAPIASQCCRDLRPAFHCIKRKRRMKKKLTKCKISGHLLKPRPFKEKLNNRDQNNEIPVIPINTFTSKPQTRWIEAISNLNRPIRSMRQLLISSQMSPLTDQNIRANWKGCRGSSHCQTRCFYPSTKRLHITKKHICNNKPVHNATTCGHPL